MPHTTSGFEFDNSYARDLEGLYAAVEPGGFASPKLMQWNEPLAKELGIDSIEDEVAAAWIGGNELPPGASPLAQAYAGHQFGGFSRQLGDGRALLLGEIVDVHGRRRDLQLKGSGPTPFSRGGDGKAAVGPVLREYLIGEAMYALGVPTTRALGAVTTGEPVYRDQPLRGAVLARVASSHIRVGTFEFFAARGDQEKLRRLADYTIARHYPALREADNPYLELLLAVGDVQARLIAQWMHLGFVHGVMNTDNVTVSGETIDYGPCAFMEAYDLATVFSSIDARGRYAYGNQPKIGQWNLGCFADALLPLLADDEEQAVACARDSIDQFPARYDTAWLDGMRHKLGLSREESGDLQLAQSFVALLGAQGVDYTSGFRRLSGVLREELQPLRSLFDQPEPLEQWLERWRARVRQEPTPPAAIADAMEQVNPLYIPRNHMTEQALTAASEDDDLGPFERLLDAITRPFEERSGLEDHATAAPPDFGPYRTFCGT